MRKGNFFLKSDFETTANTSFENDLIILKGTFSALVCSPESCIPYEQNFRLEIPKIELYAKDGRHPSFAGSYLIASVFYSALFPTNFSYKYSGKMSRRKARLLRKFACKKMPNYGDPLK